MRANRVGLMGNGLALVRAPKIWNLQPGCRRALVLRLRAWVDGAGWTGLDRLGLKPSSASHALCEPQQETLGPLTFPKIQKITDLSQGWYEDQLRSSKQTPAAL